MKEDEKRIKKNLDTKNKIKMMNFRLNCGSIYSSISKVTSTRIFMRKIEKWKNAILTRKELKKNYKKWKEIKNYYRNILWSIK